MESDTVIFAHISDTHFGPDRRHQRYGLDTAAHAERLVDVLNSLPFRLDFVVHTGDVATDPDERAYQLAAEIFRRLQVPAYYVTGNHDSAALIKRYLPMGRRLDLTADPELLSYAFDLRGHRLLVIDARAPAELDPQGLLSDEQLAILDRELTLDGPPLTVFCHFPPLPLGVPWLDRNMLIINGQELHRRLAAIAARLRGVFIGHIHQALSDYRHGVLYSAAPSAFAQLVGSPADEEPAVDTLSPPGFAIVQLDATRTVIRFHAFERP